MNQLKGKRTIHQEDALGWLGSQGKIAKASFVTSLPDRSEFPSLTLAAWKEWFTAAAQRVLLSTDDDGLAIFYQRDTKIDGAWVDKSYLIQKAAEATGHELLWHKIVCRADPGHATFGKPGFSHLLCFSKNIRDELTKSKMDILPLAGKSTWPRGMGLQVCQFVCRTILEHTETRTIVAPFCGQGAVLAVANELGMDAIGIELSRKRAEKAALLDLSAIGR